MMPFDLIAEKLAEWQDQLDQQALEQAEAERRTESEKNKEQVESCCNLMFSGHLKLCQESKSDFSLEEEEGEITIRLTNSLHPKKKEPKKKERKTVILGFHLRLEEILVVTYSRNSRRESEEWMPRTVPLNIP